MNIKIAIVIMMLWNLGVQAMDGDIPLKTIEEGTKSPPTKSLAQVHVEIRETLTVTNTSMAELNAQLKGTEDNIKKINGLLENVRENQNNVMQIHTNLQISAAAFGCFLCCCVILPLWIILGYVASHN